MCKLGVERLTECRGKKFLLPNELVICSPACDSNAVGGLKTEEGRRREVDELAAVAAAGLWLGQGLAFASESFWETCAADGISPR